MKSRTYFWGFVASMSLAYLCGALILLSSIGVIAWRVDRLVIWQYGFLGLGITSAVGWRSSSSSGD